MSLYSTFAKMESVDRSHNLGFRTQAIAQTVSVELVGDGHVGPHGSQQGEALHHLSKVLTLNGCGQIEILLAQLLDRRVLDERTQAMVNGLTQEPEG